MSIIKIWKNRGQIIEGITNNIFKKEDVEEIAFERLNICNQCSEIDRKGDTCEVPLTHPCCSQCGCSLKLKVRALSSDCPLKKWLAVLDQFEEDKLKEKIGIK